MRFRQIWSQLSSPGHESKQRFLELCTPRAQSISTSAIDAMLPWHHYHDEIPWLCVTTCRGLLLLRCPSVRKKCGEVRLVTTSLKEVEEKIKGLQENEGQWEKEEVGWKRELKVEEKRSLHVWTLRETRGQLEPRCGVSWVKMTTQDWTKQEVYVHTHLSGVVFHVHCDGLGCHHAYVIQVLFLVVVRLCLVIINSNCSHNYCLMHIAKTGHLRCRDYTQRVRRVR